MAKVVVTPVTSGNNTSSINNNFATLAAALNDGALWRDNPPSTANQVENDIDMNGNNLLNVGLIDAEDFTIGGSSLDQGLVATVTAAAATAVAASATAVAAANSATAITAGALQKTNNLSDLGSIATAKANLALDQVSNTSDANKPVSTATQTALNLKANLAGAAFTGAVSSTSSINAGTTLQAGGIISNTDTTQSAGSGTGAIITLGGLGVAKNINSGGAIAAAGNIAGQVITSNNGNIVATNAAGNVRGLTIYTGVNPRWQVITDGGAESGSNAGSDFSLARFNDAGTFIDNPIFSSRSTGAVRIKGAVGIAALPAGFVGETLTGQTLGTVDSSGTNLNAHILNVTAGEWDIQGIVNFIPTATTVYQRMQVGISTASATFAGLGTFVQNAWNLTNLGNPVVATPIVRLRFTVTTGIYLVSRSTFTTSTGAIDGFILARRVA